MTSGALILNAPDGRRELARWGLAAAIVLAAHIGLLAGYMMVPDDEAEGAPESPAVIVDMAPVPVSPSSPDDLAPGPEMVEAQQTPQPPPQVQPEEIETIPKFEAPAEVTLPAPEPKAVEKKPDQKPDDQKAETKEVIDNTPAPRTTAPPRSEQRTAVAPHAPSPGSSASRAAIASWRELVMMRLQQSKRYPGSAEARHEQGVVTLAFTLDRAGHVLARKVTHSSGVSALDDEALAMVMRASPLPAFPAAMTQAAVNLVVPIRFTLR